MEKLVVKNVSKTFDENKVLENVSILDLTPTAADILSVHPAPEWEGRSLAE